MMLTGETLQKVFDVLREARGYFVLRDTAGGEYVLARKEDFGTGKDSPGGDRQLSLPTTASLAAAIRQTAERMDKTPGFILEGINREIANYHEEEREREIDDLSLEAAASPAPRRVQGKRIRFEPIHGDLPPELQE